MSASATNFHIRIPVSSLLTGPGHSAVFWRNLDRIIQGEFTWGRKDPQNKDKADLLCNPCPNPNDRSSFSRAQIEFKLDQGKGYFIAQNIGSNSLQTQNQTSATTLLPSSFPAVLSAEEQDWISKGRLRVDYYRDDNNIRTLTFSDMKLPDNNFSLRVYRTGNGNQIYNEEILASLPEVNGHKPYDRTQIHTAKSSNFAVNPLLVPKRNEDLRFIIGSNTKACLISSDNRFISRTHLDIHINKEQRTISFTDLDSTNGTYYWKYQGPSPTLEEFKPQKLKPNKSKGLRLRDHWTVCLGSAIFIRNDPQTQTMTISEEGKESRNIKTKFESK